MNNESGELSPAFLAEIKDIVKIIIDRYHLKCTGIEDKKFTDEIIRISKKYRNPEMHLLCEKVATDNFYIRRLMLGQTLDEIASSAGVNPETAARYEAGKEKITENIYEFARITIAYGYNYSDINEIFLYGASFHDLFHIADHGCLCSKEGLTFVPNPFSAAIENLFPARTGTIKQLFKLTIYDMEFIKRYAPNYIKMIKEKSP